MKNRFTGKTRIFLLISAAIILVALVMQICGVGINLGIDFTGGSLLSYSVGESYDVEDVYTILKAAGYDEYQVTKVEASDASKALRDELAQEAADALAAEAAETDPTEVTAEEAAETVTETAETVEETAQAIEETAETAEAVAEAVEEATTEETAPVAKGLLNLDKSGIKDDGLTDLQIRLSLVDTAKGLDKAVDAAVKEAAPELTLNSYKTVTNAMINQNAWDQAYSGGYVAEYELTGDVDTDAITTKVTDALKAAGYPVVSVSTVTNIDNEEEAIDETAEEATEETAEATTGETAEEATEETLEATEPEEIETPKLYVLVSINDATKTVRDLIETEMKAKYPDFVFVTIDHVSAVAGRDLIANAVKALLIAFACMLIYIAIRFDFYSGVVALAALIHDVLVMCAFMVFFRKFFQANSAFIAAVLTIVGYSINNTIIIFDRIRETAKKPGYTLKPRMEIVEMSVSATLSRTINTSVTTLLTLIALYIFGVDAIREFAFPLIVGMLAGTYSSVLLSGQVWAMWTQKRIDKKAAKKAKV